MEKKIFDFRCPIDNSLFCKCTIESNIQVKCRKCKKFYYFIDGIGIVEDANNYFKGDE